VFYFLLNKMKKLIYILLIPVLFACSKEHDLNETVYIADPSAEGLPIYSENGYNSFGCYIDRKVFRSSNDIIPVKILIKDNSTIVVLDGVGSDFNNSKITLTFKFNDKVFKKYGDFSQWRDKTFDLKEENIDVYWSEVDKNTPLQLLGGEIEFKRVLELSVDNEPEEIILSGTFLIKALINDVPTTFSEGRFDLGINNNNFYVY